MKNFVIFAHPRSGSTSLARVLGESPDVKLAIEPFHPDYIKWNPKEKNYSKFIKDKKTLKLALKEIFTKYNAIKILDYQLPSKLYYSLLSDKNLNIILLRRKKLLDAAISNAVGEQTRKWQKSEYKSGSVKLKPLNIKKLKSWIKYVGELLAKYLKFLQEHRSGDFMLLTYENLYSKSLYRNKKTLGKICKFLEIRLPPDSAIKNYMLPTNAKINYRNIYRRIPNYEEIIKKLIT